MLMIFRTRTVRQLGLAGLLGLLAVGEALSWGADGHRMVTLAAVGALPAEVPGFLRTPQAAEQLGELAREPDRSKGAGLPHDADLDPAHYVNLDDTGRIGGGPLLSALPRTRAEYDTALRVAGEGDSARLGYLPYALIGGWQQLVKDFGYWRVDRAGETRAADPGQRAWFARDRALREMLVLRDLGYWSHFVGDAAQPLHVSIHYNSWGNYPNPNNYTSERIHGPFEGAFVHAHVALADVEAALAAPRTIDAPIQGEVSDYLAAGQREAEPLFALWTARGFDAADPSRGKAFAVRRLSAGASELRDLVVSAWRASATSTVGYPAVKVQDVETGMVAPPYEAMVGMD
jgi:hypothetical protein